MAGQTGLLRGTVVDSASGDVVPGANVVILATSEGASTGQNGGFVLGPVNAGSWRLVASHVAFEPETIAVDVPAYGVARVAFRLRVRVIPVQGVDVRSRRGEEKVSEREISSEQLSRNAGGFVQDPVRSLAFLPGVGQSARGEWSGTYAVRGGEPDESSVWFGNTELLWPYHLLGFSSVINPDIVSKVTFYPSVFPSQYGDALSSVAVMEPKRSEHGEGAWAYDPMNMKAAYVGNLGDIDYLASYRRTFYYVQFGPMGAGTNTQPSYSDVNAQASMPLYGPNRIRLTVVNGSDHIVSDLLGVEEDMHESGTSMAASIESDLGKVKSDLTFYSSSHDFDLTPSVWSGTATTQQSEYGLRLDATGTVSDELELDWGAVLGKDGFTGDLLTPQVLQRADNTWAVYAAMNLKLLKQVGLDLGFRYEDVSWAPDRVLQPRAVASYFITDNITLKAGYRRLYQNSYSFLRNSCASFVFDQQYDDYKLFETGALAAKQADHYSVSSEFKLAKSISLTLEGYIKDYSRLPTWKTDGQDNVYDPGNQGYGYARGIELTASYPSSFLTPPSSLPPSWSGWLTYGLAWCRKQQGTDTMLFWDEYDRRHSFSLQVQKTFGAEWTLAATFRLNTGAPYTPLLYTNSPNESNSADLNHGLSPFVIEGGKNSARVPVYNRLDLKLSHEMPKLPLHPYMYIEIVNVYNQQNAYNLTQFEDQNGNIITGESTGIPFTPLVGIGGRF
ncbi:MAG TPA: carboxypeptidase regulatory-like domain-containing protein [bacterium]|nr:carboxypeptidase regulatory-like domain-containing protein [bacterium]